MQKQEAEESVKLDSVPGLPGASMILKANVGELRAQLKRGGTIEIMPVGMGVGCRLTTLPDHRGYWQRASDATCQFFNVRSLYVQQIDCD